MGFKPNYNQQRAERDRAKQLKKQEKLKQQQEETARRKAAARDEPPASGGDDDVVYWRPPRGEALRPLTAADRRSLDRLLGNVP